MFIRVPSFLQFSLILLIFVIQVIDCPKAFAGSACLEDFRVNQSWQAHSLSSFDLAALNEFARSGQPGRGWHYLADLGDNYASLAARVVDPDPQSPGAYFQKYVRKHWVNVVGLTTMNLFFKRFARQHFRQYVEVLNSGTWPDSDQILNSYLTAARTLGLPEKIVFDAAWTASDYSTVVSWQVLNLLPFERQILDSRICLRIDKTEANDLISRDFSDELN
jgi:hypothetical protein